MTNSTPCSTGGSRLLYTNCFRSGVDVVMALWPDLVTGVSVAEPQIDLNHAKTHR